MVSGASLISKKIKEQGCLRYFKKISHKKLTLWTRDPEKFIPDPDT
jgi:hypothetical protein